MKPEGKCKCGKKATDIILTESGLGLEVINICNTCLSKAKTLTKELLDITGMSEFNVPNKLRPQKKINNEHIR
jgi:hypothetical protein